MTFSSYSSRFRKAYLMIYNQHSKIGKMTTSTRVQYLLHWKRLNFWNRISSLRKSCGIRISRMSIAAKRTIHRRAEQFVLCRFKWKTPKMSLAVPRSRYESLICMFSIFSYNLCMKTTFRVICYLSARAWQKRGKLLLTQSTSPPRATIKRQRRSLLSLSK